MTGPCRQASPPRRCDRRGPAATCSSPSRSPSWHSPPAPAPAAAPIRIALIEGLSGSFANAGEAVYRNLLLAVERVNARGGVRLRDGARPLQLLRYDSKGTTEEAIAMLRAALDAGAGVVMQGNSSSAAAALVDALNKHNEREPQRQAIFLNYSAVDPALTNEKCSFWHFRFDAHADMRLAALTEVLRRDAAVRRIYLIGQDYSFGQYVLKRGREMLREKRPDIEVVGDELHPMGRVKDFAPYAAKIKASGAQAVLTGNWGNDLTLLVKAAREAGVDARFYTFYGNGLGAPAAIGEAGVGRVLAVAEWHPNLGTPASDAFYDAFRQRFPKPQDDYVHARMHAMVELLAGAIERANSTQAAAVALALEGASLAGTPLAEFHQGTLRASDHQFIQPLVVSEMQRVGTPGVRFDNEGSGYGFRTVLRLPPAQTELPTTCRMSRPSPERP
ncbi:branched-chain amino acid ABC transporter substrate-binding protein [Piscinibacter sakaiensis]|uniref:branched-chain amino acid ABC transporter substrate-binding protein n=1 Tax=Piscinibacter sakaiensis TaxID=1547922 RepID=UPI00372D7E84